MAKRKRGTVVGKPVVSLGPLAPAKPLAPVRPPAGTYDPALDSAQGAAQRGYNDMAADFTRDYGVGGLGGRAGHDYTLGMEELGLQRGDVERGAGRSLADLLTGRTREGEDFGRSIQTLDRNYGEVGRQQAEGARSRGILSQGLLAKSAQVRDANKAFDRAPIDTAHTRFGQDSATAETRIGEDKTRSLEGLDRQGGYLGLQYGRGLEDANTGLSRAGRENTQFGVDTQSSRLYQATGTGWSPPAAPKPAAPAAAARNRRRGTVVGKPVMGLSGPKVGSLIGSSGGLF